MPIGLAVAVVPFSILIGWNLVTVVLFWFLLVPGLAIYLPSLILRNKVHLNESLIGLLIFYALIVFMIYDHYQTDYFKVMIFSCIINLILVSVTLLKKKLKVERTMK